MSCKNYFLQHPENVPYASNQKDSQDFSVLSMHRNIHYILKAAMQVLLFYLLSWKIAERTQSHRTAMVFSEGIFKRTEHTANTYSTETKATNPTDPNRKQRNSELGEKSGALFLICHHGQLCM